VGSIDLLARDGGHAQVVDYKTGSAPLAASEAKDRYRLQGACYALAVLRGGAEQATVSFVEIERGCRETLYEYAREHISAIEAELLGVLDRMRAGEWDPCDRYDPRTCDGCPALGGLCPVTPPRAA
jgi:RecB family exonuclease